MPRQERRSTLIFLWCTLLTALGSVAASAMELPVSLGLGWGYAWFDFLLVLTISSTVGLAVGAYLLFIGDHLANILIVLSCLYIPIAFIALTVEGFIPPAGWWPLLPLGLADIVFGLSRLRTGHAPTDKDVQA